MNTSGFHPAKNKVPRHVGLIPDGGRRWAKANNCSLAESYQKTKKLIREMVVFLIESGVFEISIYLSSIQNFRRSTDEIEAFNSVSTLAFKDDIFKLSFEKELKISVAGNRSVIPISYLAAIEFAESSTKHFTKGVINILVAYNPIDEIIEAISNSPQPNRFLHHLWVTTPIDLIIRSGGANLLSNFLPLQSGFARLIFYEKLFNDLTINDVKIVLNDFFNIERKYGE